MQYRINAAGVCSVSVVATFASTTSGVTYTTVRSPKACPAREWRGEAVFDALPGTLVIGVGRYHPDYAGHGRNPLEMCGFNHLPARLSSRAL